MKKNVIKTVLASMICFYMACTNDVYAEQENPETPGFVWTHTGFTEKIVFPNAMWMYRPKLKIVDDKLYVSHNTGIFSKNLNEADSAWELFALGDLGWPVIDFVKNGDKILAISNTGSYRDSLLYLSVDNGKTFENFTSPDLFQGNYDYGWICAECNTAIQITQHPENPDVIALLTHFGVSISEDFGVSWRIALERIPMGQDWVVAFHPLDANTMFYSGEQMNQTGVIYKSSDGGLSWSYYDTMGGVAGGDDCIHSITYHPTNPDIIVYSGEGTIGKSTDRGETWNRINLKHTGMYFYKILFDKDNPEIIYATGGEGGSLNKEDFHLYRSTDMGDSWQHVFEHNTNVTGGGEVIDMVQYKNKLFLYTTVSGVAELDLGTTTGNAYIKTVGQPSLTVFPNPAQNRLYFDTDLAVNHIEIISQTGQLLQKTNVLNNERQIDISHLPAGVYFAIFHARELTVTKKIAVMK